MSINIVGHELQEKILYENYHHSYSWMACGAKGLGKFSLIKEFAQNIVKSDIDILTISKPTIKVEDAHEVTNFLMHTSEISALKIVIIDDFDGININAVNSLLKITEESIQKSLIFIISHNPYIMIPTMKSRLRVLNFQSLSLQQMEKIFDKGNKSLFPIVNGSPGLLFNLLELGGVELYKDIIYALQLKYFNHEISSLIMHILQYIINQKLKLLYGLELNEIFEKEKTELDKITLDVNELLMLNKRSSMIYTQSRFLNLNKSHVSNFIFS